MNHNNDSPHGDAQMVEHVQNYLERGLHRDRDVPVITLTYAQSIDG